MCDISLEREFNYLLHGISQVQIFNKNINDRRFVTLPHNVRQGSKYKVHVLDLSRFKKKLVSVRFGGGGGARWVVVAHDQFYFVPIRSPDIAS